MSMYLNLSLYLKTVHVYIQLMYIQMYEFAYNLRKYQYLDV